MNKWFRRFAVISSSVFVLTGCSLFSSEEDVVEMAELPVFEATYEPQIAWEKGIGSGVDKYYSQLKPGIDYQAVYVASREGRVRAYDVTDGSFLWSKDFGEHESNLLNRSARFSGGIAVSPDAIYIGTENAQVLSLNKETGDLNWIVQVTGEIVAQPAYDSGAVVVHTTRGDLIALDSDTGEELWSLQHKQPNLTLRSSSAPTVAQGGVIYGRSDGHVSAALLATGQGLWQVPIARPFGATELERIVDVDMKPIIRNGIVYALAYNGNLVAIELLKGEVKWTRKYSGYNNIALAGQTLFITDSRGSIYALSRDSGREIWANNELSYRNLTGITIANQFIVVGDGEGYLHWIDRENGQFVAQQLLDKKGLYVEPVASSTHLYLQTRGGKLVVLEKPSINVQ